MTDLDTTSPPSILVAGHRGLRLEYPDNTLEGILAASAVCDMVEFDVRSTREGIAVLSHDAHLDGTAIIDMDWATLAKLDVGNGLHPTRLDDVLDAAGTYPFNFEIKNSPADPDFDQSFAFACEVGGRASTDDLITCFHWPTVDAVRDAYPNLATGLLVDPAGSLRGAADWAIRSGHQVIAPHWSLLAGPSVIEIAALVKQGLEVVVWTVNDEDIARSLAGAGANTIITDDPIRMVAVLQGRRRDEYQG